MYTTVPWYDRRVTDAVVMARGIAMIGMHCQNKCFVLQNIPYVEPHTLDFLAHGNARFLGQRCPEPGQAGIHQELRSITNRLSENLIRNRALDPFIL